MSRVDAILVWLRVFSELNGLPELHSLNAVWKDHIGSLGYLCHAHECQKKTFASPSEAFKDAEFVLVDLQDVKAEPQKISHFKDVDFQAAAAGNVQEIYKCLLLMIAEVLIYFRKSSGELEAPYYSALQEAGLEEVFAETMQQVISADNGSWWKYSGFNDVIFLKPLDRMTEICSSTPQRKARNSLYKTPLPNRISSAHIMVTSNSSPLKELFDSPRMAELSSTKEVVKLKNRIEELIEELALKDDELKIVRGRLADAINEYKHSKQRTIEFQQEADIREESISSLEGKLDDLKGLYNEKVACLDETKDRLTRSKKKLDHYEHDGQLLRQQKIELEEQKSYLLSQLRDAEDRQNSFDRLESTLEAKISTQQAEISKLAEELASTMYCRESEQRRFKEDLEKKENFYEELLFGTQTKLAAMDKLLTEKTEELDATVKEARTRSLADHIRHDESLSKIEDAYNKELDGLRRQVGEVTQHSLLEKERHINEFQSLADKHSSELSNKIEEHNKFVISLKRHHELEIHSLQSKMDLKDQLIERQKEEIEVCKKEMDISRGNLLKVQQEELASCKSQADLLNQERELRLSFEEERLSHQVEMAEMDRFWRKEVEQYSTRLEELQRLLSQNGSRMNSQAFEYSSIERIAGGLEETIPDEAIIPKLCEEPTRLEQKTVDHRKAESFFVDFDQTDDEEAPEPSASRMPYVEEIDQFPTSVETSPALRATDRDRVATLRLRNSLQPQALRSSYTTEFGGYSSPTGSEEYVKGENPSRLRRMTLGLKKRLNSGN